MFADNSGMNKINSFLIIVAFLAVSIFSCSADLYALSGLGLGVKAGMVTNYDKPDLEFWDYDIDNLGSYGAFISFGRDAFALEVGVERFSDDFSFTIEGDGVTGEVKDFFFHATTKLYFQFPVIQPFVGIGIAGHKLTYEYSGSLGTFEDAIIKVTPNKTYLGYHLVAGGKLAFAVLPFDVFLEMRMGRIEADGDAIKFAIVSGGVIFNLP